MKKYMFLLVLFSWCVSCNGQNSEEKNELSNLKEHVNNDKPKGSWKVDKEFDEHGNLIKYDSIYSWSSSSHLNNLSSLDRDSIIESFKSKFHSSFSKFNDDNFGAIFSQDSLFNQRFFNDTFFDSNFGKDLMELDKLREQMIARQKEFLKNYYPQIISPEK
ncbi:hypothetical protein AB9K24_10140 [Meridianimaribacter flavus]